MQWGFLTEEKQKNHLAQTEFRFIKNKGWQLPLGLRLYISIALQQKTANFKAAIESRDMQWSVLTKDKQKNELAQTEFIIIGIRGAITCVTRHGTCSSSPLYQHCTAAKDGQFQDGHIELINAAESIV